MHTNRIVTPRTKDCSVITMIRGSHEHTPKKIYGLGLGVSIVSPGVGGGGSPLAGIFIEFVMVTINGIIATKE